MEELLDACRRAGRACPCADPRSRAGNGASGSSRHRLVHDRVVDAVEFEPEEQKVARRSRQPLLRVAVELGAHRIRGVAGIDEPGIGHQAAEQILHGLVALHALRRAPMRRILAVGDRIELAAIGLRERLALGLGPGEVGLERLRFRCPDRDATGPIPVRHRDRSPRPRRRLPLGRRMRRSTGRLRSAWRGAGFNGRKVTILAGCRAGSTQARPSCGFERPR